MIINKNGGCCCCFKGYKPWDLFISTSWQVGAPSVELHPRCRSFQGTVGKGWLTVNSKAFQLHGSLNGYGSIPINTIFSGMNIHKSQLFWCSPGVQGFDTLPNVPIEHHPTIRYMWSIMATIRWCPIFPKWNSYQPPSWVDWKMSSAQQEDVGGFELNWLPNYLNTIIDTLWLSNIAMV